MAAVQLSVAIQTHPIRDQLACALVDEIGEGELVCDPEPDGFRSPWRCYREALELTPADATHRVVLQDDVTLCHCFALALRAAIEARPDSMITLFHGGKPGENLHVLDRALHDGVPWAKISIRRWVPVVALVWPARVVRPALDWIEEQNYPPKFRSDDEIVGRAMRALREDVYATVPSLVQHEDRLPSLIGLRASAGRDPARVARHFFGDIDPTGVDWTRGA